MTKATIILERFPYRFVQKGLLEINGEPDYRIQKFNDLTRQYNDMYYLDSGIQLDACLEDHEYVKWLDPDPEFAASPPPSATVVSPYV